MSENERTKNIKRLNIGIGTIIAICISWSQNNSIFWALIHGFLNWIYIFYYVIFK